MHAANDTTLSRLQLEINRALIENNTEQLIDCLCRYMKATGMTVTEEVLLKLPLHKNPKPAVLLHVN